MLLTLVIIVICFQVILSPKAAYSQDDFYFEEVQRINATILKSDESNQCPSAESLQTAKDNITQTVRQILQEEINAIKAANAPCGGFGWRQIGFFNMSDTSYNCPTGLMETTYSKRTCGRSHRDPRRCDSHTMFSAGGQPYSRVCGRIHAYQYGYNIAFYGYHASRNTLNGEYVSGISLTHGRPTREHIWTFGIGLFSGFGSPGPVFNEKCPCEAGNTFTSPTFVGDDYFCESGVPGRAQYSITFFPDQLLWDGEGCLSNSTCCQLNNPPWFIKNLDTPTTDDVELRICTYDDITLTDTAIELLELYVQ